MQIRPPSGTRMKSRTFIACATSDFWAVYYLLQLLLASSTVHWAQALQCFSCHGECYSERHCNCQTGMCEGEYCFTERWAREGGFIIYKGCGKGLPGIGTMNSCDYQRLQERAFCMCDDENFCNEWSASPAPPPNNATCLQCSRGECSSRCNFGQYCLADFTGNQYKCAYGKPMLAFHYQSKELQQTDTKPWPACVSFRAGPAHHIAECACTTPLCNNPTHLRDQIYFDESSNPLIHCHSCAEEMLSESVLPSCRRQSCLGQFCAVKVESIFDALISALAGVRPSASASTGGTGTSAAGSSSSSSWTRTYRYKVWSGCVNSTRPDQVLHGTFQRWTVGTRQVTECVCTKSYCNVDVKSCIRAAASAEKGVSLIMQLCCVVLLIAHFLL